MPDALQESLLLLAVGMTGVMASLVFLAAMIASFKMIDERMNSWKIRRYAERVATHLPEDEPGDELTAVIAAAVAATLRRPVRIRRVRLFNAPGSGAWSSMGRLNIMASHHIARRKS
jgi:Na+-transporting methylmalonyl-CoA/oxaloacetate decarboxylase gamma subunit